MFLLTLRFQKQKWKNKKKRRSEKKRVFTFANCTFFRCFSTTSNPVCARRDDGFLSKCFTDFLTLHSFSVTLFPFGLHLFLFTCKINWNWIVIHNKQTVIMGDIGKHVYLTDGLVHTLNFWNTAKMHAYNSSSETLTSQTRTMSSLFVYYEPIKREVKRRLIYENRCDERLKTKNEESTRLADTGLVVELEHLKTKTRLIDEKFGVWGVSVTLRCDRHPV